MSDTKPLKVCLLHPKPVYYDDPRCPCCKVTDERFRGLVKPRLREVAGKKAM